MNCFMIFFISLIIIIHPINTVYKLFHCYLFFSLKKNQNNKMLKFESPCSFIVNAVRFNITVGVEFF